MNCGGNRLSLLLPVKIESFSAYVMFMYELVSCLLTVEKERKKKEIFFPPVSLFFVDVAFLYINIVTTMAGS